MSEFIGSLFSEEHIAKTPSTDWKWSFKDYPTEKNGIQVFSCFSCGGGSTMGYKLAGCDVIGCCEIDPKMFEVYKRNHHPRFGYNLDIRDFNALDDLPPELYDLDILDGSPPCTPFSMSGDREESWGVAKKFKEGQKEQTLDDLFFVFIETVRKLKPRLVIAENVEGLMKGNALDYCHRIHREFKREGYICRDYLLKGETMGIPQQRHRMFFIAVRDDVSFDYENLNLTFDYEEIPFKTIKAGKGRVCLPESEAYKTLSVAIPYERKFEDTYKRIGDSRKCFNHKMIWEDLVCLTISTRRTLYRVREKQYLSDEDIIHASTFPEDYNFGKQDVCYVCGMSVPPVMIKRIVTRLIEAGFRAKERDSR